ncbi:MAG TPA: hypothetical protein ENK43_17670 [Planctomycetes bacterium]|nr:hypothetical protein [Planctomycetota bacterium]
MHPPRFLKLILLFLALPTFGQTTLHVDIGGGAAFTSIQAAVLAAAPGDTILVEPGVYDEHVIIAKDLTLRSTQGPAVTAIAPVTQGTAVNVGDVITLAHLSVTVEGFRMTSTGSNAAFGAPAQEGGIRVTSFSTLFLRNCVVAGCSGGNAFGGFFPDGAAGGIALFGGIFTTTAPTTLIMENCLVANNHGGNGTTSGGAGGISQGVNTSCEMRHCTFSGNVGGMGGGTPPIAPPGIGALDAQQGTALVENSVFWGDQGGTNGLGAAVNEIAGAATVSNCDVEGGFAGTGNIDVDPLFTGPATGDYSPQAGSPVIDAGVCSATNPRGHDVAENPRVRGFAPDMGAYEFLHDTTRMGTSEDILLTTVVNGNNANALLNTKNIVGGDMLVVHWESPCGSLDGGLYYLGAQFYVPGQEPMPQFPFVYLDSIGGSIIQGPIPLPAGGVDFNMTVPMGSFMPAVVRVQVLVVTPLAHHLPFAVTSDAQDLIFQ